MPTIKIENAAPNLPLQTPAFVIRISSAKTPIHSRPNPADHICSRLTCAKIGSFFWMISNKAIMAKLHILLPSTLPMARSGSLAMVTESMLVTNSANDVRSARTITLIQICPGPVRSQIWSSYRANFEPAIKMIPLQRTNCKSIRKPPKSKLLNLIIQRLCWQSNWAYQLSRYSLKEKIGLVHFLPICHQRR